MTGFVYTLSDTGIIFYVGGTFDVDERLKSHRTKFGYNIILEILEACEVKNRNDLFVNEEFWTMQLKQWGFYLLNKDCYPRYVNAPSEIIHYVSSIFNKDDSEKQMTKQYFLNVVWGIIKEHKKANEKCYDTTK